MPWKAVTIPPSIIWIFRETGVSMILLDNKKLHDMFKTAKRSSFNRNITGLFFNAYPGGVTVYATDGVAVCRKVFSGDNDLVFVSYFDNWESCTGTTELPSLAEGEEKSLGGRKRHDMVKAMDDYFVLQPISSFYINKKEYMQSKNAVDAVNKGGFKHSKIVFSAHDNKINVASWNDDSSVCWELYGNYNVKGSVCLSRQYLDFLKFSDIKNSVKISFLKNNKSDTFCKINDDIFIMSKAVDEKAFADVLGYGYAPPEEYRETVDITVVKTVFVKSSCPSVQGSLW